MDMRVADLSLAPLGRAEIRLAEHEMPGLMALRGRYTDDLVEPGTAQTLPHPGVAVEAPVCGFRELFASSRCVHQHPPWGSIQSEFGSPPKK